LKKNKIPYTSDLIRSAIENSARPLTLAHLTGGRGSGRNGESQRAGNVVYTKDLVFGGGSGSINVVNCCALIEAVASASRVKPFAPPSKGESARDIAEVVRPPLGWRYQVAVEAVVPLAARKCVGSSAGAGVLGGTRGVYLRGKSETQCVQRMSVNLDAVRDDEKYLPSNKAALAAMETTIAVEATEPWVAVPKSVLLYGAGRAFPIVVDPTCLEAGKVHYAEIAGFVDLPGTARSRYRVFRLPVTVVVPESPLEGTSVVRALEDIEMSPGAVTRRFYAPPVGASYGILRITAATANTMGPGPLVRLSATQPEQLSGFGDGGSEVTTASDSTIQGHAALEETHSNEGRSREQKAVGYGGASAGEVSVYAAPDHVASSMSSESRMLDIHIVQVEPRQPTKHTETRQALALVPGATKEVMFPLGSSSTVEIAIGHRWSSMGNSHIRAVEVVFCGLQPTPNALHLEPGAVCFPRLDVTNLLPDGHAAASRPNSNPHVISTFHPKASLSTVRRAIAPFYSKISQVSGDRDFLPDARQLSRLILEFKFEVHENGTTVSLSFPGLNSHVYEGDVEGGPFVTLHDANKHLLLCSDIYPDQRVLKKGTYYARAIVRHDSPSVLEKLREARCVVTYRLSSPITLDCFDTAQGAALFGETSSKMRGSKSKDWKGLVEPGERRSLYFNAPKKSSIPKWACVGDSLYGEFTVDEAVFLGSGDTRQATRIPKYCLSMPAPVLGTANGKPMAEILSTASDASAGTQQVASGGKDADGHQCPATDPVEEDSKWLDTTMNNLRMKALRGFLKDNKLADFDRICSSMSDDSSSDCDFLLLKLQRLDAALWGGGSVCSNARMEAVGAVVRTADDLLARLNPTEVAAHFGLRNIELEKTEEMKEMELKKAMIVAALFRKARALFDTMGDDEHDANEEEAEVRDMAFDELQRWHKMDGKSFLSDGVNMLGETGSVACIRAEDFMMFAAKRHKMRGCPALALRAVDSYLGSSHADGVASRRVAEARLHILKELKWDHFVNYEEQALPLRFPKGLEPL
jgi:hypothetical protein